MQVSAATLALTHADQVFCVYAIDNGSTSAIAIQSLIRANFDELRAHPAELVSELAVYVSEDQSTAMLASELADRAPSPELKTMLTEIARDSSSLSAETRQVEHATRDYANAKNDANLTKVVSLEDSYLSAAAQDHRNAPVAAVTTATDDLCLKFETAAGEASTAVFFALKAAGDSPLTPARILTALGSPAYRGFKLIEAIPKSRVTNVAILANGFRICLALKTYPAPIRWIACP
ncbi:MAG TPA: hypothetical protein VGS61_01940 [Acidimicrobiales bacterium]|nr:hypothetical protein [Acidimicrobiales bacterium]